MCAFQLGRAVLHTLLAPGYPWVDGQCWYLAGSIKEQTYATCYKMLKIERYIDGHDSGIAP